MITLMGNRIPIFMFVLLAGLISSACIMVQRLTERIANPTVQSTNTVSRTVTGTITPNKLNSTQPVPTVEMLISTNPYPAPESYSEMGNAYPGNPTPQLSVTEEEVENTNPVPATQFTPTSIIAMPSPGENLTSTSLPAWMFSKLQATDPKEFSLASGKYQLVEFFAFWNGTSQAMAPIINKLEIEFGDQMNFVYLDIDNPANDEYEKSLKYRTPPHFFLLDAAGNVLKQWQGYVDENELVQSIKSLLK